MNVAREPYSPPPITITLDDTEAWLLLMAVNRVHGYSESSESLRKFAAHFEKRVAHLINRNAVGDWPCPRTMNVI